MRFIIAFLLALGAEHSLHAATVNEHLYIVADSLQLAGGDKIPYSTFNETTAFSQKNARIELTVGDDLDLWVVNLDTVTHQFEIRGLSATYSIPAGDSMNVLQSFSTAGLFIFLDPTNFPDYASTGLGGMIVVKDHAHASFYWNVKEHQQGWNEVIAAGGSVDWSTYYPTYFTINGFSNPMINSDPDARIVGNVNDTLMVYIANTGQSIHALHFHGYHVEIMYSSKFPSHVGRIKDSNGVYPYETVVARLIPDKPGEYPVHDHNLIATTGGNQYPFGMFTTILITP